MPLRIVQISTHSVSGGAARCAYQLHRSLIDRGHECRMLVARAETVDPTVEVLPPASGLAARVRRRLRRRRINRDLSAYQATRPDWPERFSDDRSSHDWRHAGPLEQADVVNLHWVGGLVDYRRFFDAVPAGVPAVWTLHDKNVFTGGCHYDAGCGRYLGRCGACPQLGSTDERDLSRRVWERKRALFQSLDRGRLVFVTPSRWLEDEVTRSPMLGDRFAVTTIPNGVDTEEFASRDRAAAREALGIPQDGRVVLFVAYSLRQRRKGFALLISALRELADLPNLFLLSVGAGIPVLELPVPQLHLGKVEQNRFLSLVYSAADVYVIPSLEDNLPSTVLEAMACGTPVVGFEVGGIPEMVEQGATGALSPVADVPALARNIAGLLTDPQGRSAMSERCRRRAVERFGMNLCTHRYEELYHGLATGKTLGSKAGSRTKSENAAQ